MPEENYKCSPECPVYRIGNPPRCSYGLLNRAPRTGTPVKEGQECVHPQLRASLDALFASENQAPAKRTV